jgi:hypothetical protein
MVMMVSGISSGKLAIMMRAEEKFKGWYHLSENLHKVGGSNSRLKRVESYLWSGEVELAKAEFEGCVGQEVENFKDYLDKHRSRIPDYKLYQESGICIGSGAVESTIKRLGARVKISGAQWKVENVPQLLRLRCAYLNQAIA